MQRPCHAKPYPIVQPRQLDTILGTAILALRNAESDGDPQAMSSDQFNSRVPSAQQHEVLLCRTGTVPNHVLAKARVKKSHEGGLSCPNA
jgi:hypothetical protein